MIPVRTVACALTNWMSVMIVQFPSPGVVLVCMLAFGVNCLRPKQTTRFYFSFCLFFSDALGWLRALLKFFSCEKKIWSCERMKLVVKIGGLGGGSTYEHFFCFWRRSVRGGGGG